MAGGSPPRAGRKTRYDSPTSRNSRSAGKSAGRRGPVRASVPPRSKGELVVTPLRPPRRRATSFRSSFPPGRLPRRRLPACRVGRSPRPSSAVRTPAAGPPRPPEEDRLAGIGTHIIGASLSWPLTTRAAGCAEGSLRLAHAPRVSVSPRSADRLAAAPLPERPELEAPVTYSQTDGENIRVTIEGTYDHFDGAMRSW